ncbi:MAG: SixA phosphatase family protein [Bacteroidota bacterium]
MKTLILMRHGKSSWEDLDLEDHERPLLKKGIKRTMKISRFLAEKKIKPDIIISSIAVRAYDTAGLIAKNLEYPAEKIVMDESLYFSGMQAIEDVICKLPNSSQSAMIVGHNPDMTRFANQFLEEKIDYLPTSAVMGLRFHCSHWREIMLSTREILFVMYPRMLE